MRKKFIKEKFFGKEIRVMQGADLIDKPEGLADWIDPEECEFYIVDKISSLSKCRHSGILALNCADRLSAAIARKWYKKNLLRGKIYKRIYFIKCDYQTAVASFAGGEPFEYWEDFGYFVSVNRVFIRGSEKQKNNSADTKKGDKKRC